LTYLKAVAAVNAASQNGWENMRRQLARLGAMMALTAVVALALPAASAFGAAAGPGASGGGSSGGGSAPTPNAIVCPTITVDSSTGGSGTCDGVTVTVPTQTSTTCPDIIATITVNPVGAIAVPNPPSGYVQAYAVTVKFTCSSTGAVFTGTLSPAATVVVTNAAIAAGRPIFEYAGGAWSQVTTATVTTGSATFTVPTDPQFVFYAPVIAGSTVAVTGKPVVGEGIVAGVLFALGLLGIWRATRRRRAPIGV
jgi:hypothetical protein